MYGTLMGMKRRESKDAQGNTRSWYDIYLGSTEPDVMGIRVDHLSMSGDHFGGKIPAIGDVLLVDVATRTRKDGGMFTVVEKYVNLKHDELYVTPTMES